MNTHGVVWFTYLPNTLCMRSRLSLSRTSLTSTGHDRFSVYAAIASNTLRLYASSACGSVLTVAVRLLAAASVKPMERRRSLAHSDGDNGRISVAERSRMISRNAHSSLLSSSNSDIVPTTSLIGYADFGTALDDTDPGGASSGTLSPRYTRVCGLRMATFAIQTHWV